MLKYKRKLEIKGKNYVNLQYIPISAALAARAALALCTTFSPCAKRNRGLAKG